MKTIIITITFIFCTAISTNAQNNQIKIGTLDSDSIGVMEYLYNKKSEFIGKPLAKFLREYERYLPIRFISARETSPWIHPEGKSFIKGITICFRDYAFMQRKYDKKAGNFVLYIEFANPQVDYFTFWGQFSESMPDQEKANSIGDQYLIKDISFYLSRIK